MHFLPILFWKLVFRLSVFYVFSVCSEFLIRYLFFVELKNKTTLSIVKVG